MLGQRRLVQAAGKYSTCRAAPTTARTSGTAAADRREWSRRPAGSHDPAPPPSAPPGRRACTAGERPTGCSPRRHRCRPAPRRPIARCPSARAATGPRACRDASARRPARVTATAPRPGQSGRRPATRACRALLLGRTHGPVAGRYAGRTRGTGGRNPAAPPRSSARDPARVPGASP
jgi:hypothetical protein